MLQYMSQCALLQRPSHSRARARAQASFEDSYSIRVYVTLSQPHPRPHATICITGYASRLSASPSRAQEPEGMLGMVYRLLIAVLLTLLSDASGRLRLASAECAPPC